MIRVNIDAANPRQDQIDRLAKAIEHATKAQALARELRAELIEYARLYCRTETMEHVDLVARLLLADEYAAIKAHKFVTERITR